MHFKIFIREKFSKHTNNPGSNPFYSGMRNAIKKSINATKVYCMKC